MHADDACSNAMIRNGRLLLVSRLVLRPPDLFNIHKKREGAWYPISCNKCWHDMMKERRSATVDFKSVCQLQFTKHSSLRLSRFYVHRTGALEDIVCPHSIITTHHPSYLCIQGNICHMRCGPRLPLSRVYVEKIGEPGDKANW